MRVEMSSRSTLHERTIGDAIQRSDVLPDFGGMWIDPVSQPIENTRTIGAAFRVNAPTISLAVDRAVELAQRAFEAAGVPFDGVQRVTLTGPH